MKQDPIKLAEDVADHKGGITKYRNIKRTDKRCPRCMSYRVNRTFRRCDNCKGALLWAPEDDIQPYFDRYEAFYIWMKSIWGLTGWYHSDYFVSKANETKY